MMKFATAAAILTQTIPDIASGQHSTSNPLGPKSPQPKKTLVSTAISSTSTRNFNALKNKASALLKNSPKPADSIKGCNPSSHDPDIGILSCGSGYQCVGVDDASTSMGGYCMPAARQLEETEIDENAVICNLCGPGMRFDVSYWLVQLALFGSLPTHVYLCVGLADRAYLPALNTTSCLNFRDSAFTFGCCTPYEFGCDAICDDKLFLPYAMIAGAESTTYCLETMRFLEMEECLGNEDAENTDDDTGFTRTEVITYCCGDKATDMPSMAPTLLLPTSMTPNLPPGNPTSATASTGSSTSASNGLWLYSTRTLVSMMSLAATITGVILLQ